MKIAVENVYIHIQIVILTGIVVTDAGTHSVGANRSLNSMTDLIQQNLLPKYAQDEAKRMVHDIEYPRKDRVLFTLITPVFAPADCVWLDPYYGMFQIIGKEDKGFMRVIDLPEGTLIINQRYESEDKDR